MRKKFERLEATAVSKELKMGSEVERLSEEIVLLRRTSMPNSDAPQAASRAKRERAKHEEHKADRRRLSSKQAGDRLPPGLISFTAPAVMLFSLLCLDLLSFVGSCDRSTITVAPGYRSRFGKHR